MRQAVVESAAREAHACLLAGGGQDGRGAAHTGVQVSPLRSATHANRLRRFNAQVPRCNFGGKPPQPRHHPKSSVQAQAFSVQQTCRHTSTTQAAYRRVSPTFVNCARAACARPAVARFTRLLACLHLVHLGLCPGSSGAPTSHQHQGFCPRFSGAPTCTLHLAVCLRSSRAPTCT